MAQSHCADVMRMHSLYPPVICRLLCLTKHQTADMQSSLGCHVGPILLAQNSFALLVVPIPSALGDLA
jgi:hypothetical protein